jgi:hypothetical protein
MSLKKRSFIFLALCIYECLRLVLIAETFTQFSLSLLEKGEIAPATLFTAPYIVFPIMIFFFWFDPKRYSIFRTLYIAGKLAVAICVFTNVFFLVLTGVNSINDIINTYLLEKSGSLLILTFGILSIIDVILSILVFVFRKTN